MALSMEEQRILEEMERKLADEDPRLASRLMTFSQPTLPALIGAGRARAVVVLVSLALAAAVTLMLYAMRPFPVGQSREAPAQRTTVAPARAGAAPSGPAAATAGMPLTPHS
jgi:hypothetical protein